MRTSERCDGHHEMSDLSVASEALHSATRCPGPVWATPGDGCPFLKAWRRKIMSRHLGPVKSRTFGGAAVTSGETPPKITKLQADKTGPLCPNETVKFVATTSPSSATVTWEVATDGGAFETVDETDRNTLEVFGVSGRKIEVKASLTPSEHKTSKPVVWKTADLQIQVPPGPNNGRYVITDKPRMPVITATALFQGKSGTVTEWKVSADFAGDDCPPF